MSEEISPVRYAKAVSKIREMEREGRSYRDTIRDLKAELATATAAAKLPEGSTLLTGDDVKRWEAFQALAKSPDEISKALQAGEEATGKLAGIDWERQARRVAKAAGVTGEDAFLVLPGVRDMAFEIRTEKENGKDVERAYVKGPDGKETRLDREAIEAREQWKPLAPALFTEVVTEREEPRGIPFSRQHADGPSGGPPKGQGIEAAIQANRARAQAGNPLRPAKQT